MIELVVGSSERSHACLFSRCATQWHITFLYQFLDNAEATLEKEKNDKWERLVESWHIKRKDQIPRQLLEYIMVEDSTLESTNIPSCDPTSDGDREITIEDFLELEEFLELEDGEKLEDLDSSREVTMEDFLELEEWIEEDVMPVLLKSGHSASREEAVDEVSIDAATALSIDILKGVSINGLNESSTDTFSRLTYDS
ncbi:hypothetical protein DY000_02021953 [Brassica cretica]|uniref:Uncharacterized protein n=1 Tax=Brassica cretica TaxID=69181 RepID=A0ABQ7E5U2_BRACR|nr:hypothetical protein DY000_02021953 [Brassica cretica]